jgi:acyl dehydratase
MNSGMPIDVSALSSGACYEVIVARNITRAMIVQYAGASGDFNPLHVDDAFVRLQTGYPSVFAHGMFTMGVTGRVVTDLLADGWRVEEISARFKRQVWPGDRLTVRVSTSLLSDDGGNRLVALELETRNQGGEVVLTGAAKLIHDQI